MKLRISIFWYTSRIPISQGILVASIIKEVLNHSNRDYCHGLYYHNKQKRNKTTKNFCTSTYLDDFEILEDEIKINGKIVLNISSPDMVFMTNLYNGFLKIQEFQYKNYKFVRGKINYIKEKVILTSTTEFKTSSPLIIKTKEGKFIGPEDEAYEKEFNYITNLILKNYRGYGLKRKLLFQSVGMKKVILKEEIKDFTINTGKKHYLISGYRGAFRLTGDIEDLNDIYQVGTGYRRGQNAGMLDVF